MEIIPKSPGVWQAGLWTICTEEHLGLDANGLYIDTSEPIEEWTAVLSRYKQVIHHQGRFLSLGKGFPSDSHVLESDRTNSAKLSYSLNVLLLIDLAESMVKEGEEIQRVFPVTETKEYSLQADLEAYFHEVHSPLFDKRVFDLRHLPEDGITIERERVRITHELQRNFESQADLLDVISLSAPKAAHLLPRLIPFAETARELAHLNRDGDEPSFKSKMENWLPLIRKKRWKPILIGSPESLEPLLREIYTL